MSEDKYPYITKRARAKCRFHDEGDPLALCTCEDTGAEAPAPVYDASEQDILLDVFRAMLASATKDGGRKRAAGLKPPWYKDDAHEAAIFSHLNKWKHGERRDVDSGVHPLIHLAWRALAVAYRETVGDIDPAQDADWRYALRPFNGRTDAL